MKPFDLDKAKAGEKICIVKGKETIDARVICADRRCNYSHNNYSVVLLINTEDPDMEYIRTCTPQGEMANDFGQVYMAPVKREGWLNIYRNNSSFIYNTEVEANSSGTGRAACIKIEWEE